MASFRAAYLLRDGSETLLTGPEHAALSDDALRTEAYTEALRAGLIDADGWPALTEEAFRASLVIGLWTE